jgi:acyl-CoA thioesterase I
MVIKRKSTERPLMKPHRLLAHFPAWVFCLLLAAFQQPNVKTILFYGDSLTAGYGLAPDQAFPALIQKEITQRKASYKVVNAGLSGETTAGGLGRISWVLKQPVDILVLELGANDGLRGLPIAQTRENLQKIIDKVKEKNPQVKVLIVGMKVPPNMGREYSREFEKIFPDLAKANKASLLPFLLEGVAGNPKLNLPDGIHPNAEGHRIVAKNVWQALEPMM